MQLTEESDSKLPMLSKCIGPAVLVTTRSVSGKATIGTAIHRHLELRAMKGVVSALAMLDETIDEFDLSEIEVAIAKSRCRSFRFEPPRGAGAELALAWRIDGDSAEVVKVRGGQGEYALPANVWAPGTIDIIYAAPEPLLWQDGRATCPDVSTLWVIDYKTGDDTWVDPVERNAQLANGAAKAAIWTGASRVVPAILHVERGDGILEAVREPWDADRISAAMWSTFDLHERIHAARQASPDEVRSMLIEGYYCRYCPSLAYCPIKAERVRNLLSLGTGEGALESVEAAKLAMMLPQIQDLARHMEQVVKAHVLEHGPIDVGNGRYYGPQTKQRDLIVGAPMFKLLADKLGKDVALDAITITKSNIDAAIKRDHDARNIKRKRAAVMREVLAAGYSVEAIRKESYEKWGLFKPGEEEEDDEP